MGEGQVGHPSSPDVLVACLVSFLNCTSKKHGKNIDFQKSVRTQEKIVQTTAANPRIRMFGFSLSLAAKTCFGTTAWIGGSLTSLEGTRDDHSGTRCFGTESGWILACTPSAHETWRADSSKSCPNLFGQMLLLLASLVSAQFGDKKAAHGSHQITASEENTMDRVWCDLHDTIRSLR